MVEVAGSPGVARTAPAAGSSFVEWGAVLAGGAMAAAISFVLLTFGSAIGLSLTSPWQDSGASAKTVASIAIFWTLAQQIGAFMIGGYIAGRMRARWAEPDRDESDFRDGLHGGLVWAVGVVIGAIFLLSTVGSVARTGTEVAGRVASVAAANADPIAYQIDALLRPASAAAATPPRASTAPGATTTSPAATATSPAAPGGAIAQNADLRAELGRILARSIANGSLAENDRIYLTAIVAQRAGMSPQEAERRVNETYAAAAQTAKEAADKARRAAVLAGFVTAASLLIGLAAAWWAAVKGGNHRDNAIPAHFFTLQRRPLA